MFRNNILIPSPHWGEGVRRADEELLRRLQILFILVCLLPSTLFASSIPWKTLWGQKADPQINIGMWSYHAGSDISISQYNNNNEALSISYDGFFAGTLLNSFYQRSYVAGIQRTISTQDLGHALHGQLGYRLGLIYGYGTEEIKTLTGLYLPLVPFPQLLYGVDWHHIGVELSWTVYVVSASFYIRL